MKKSEGERVEKGSRKGVFSIREFIDLQREGDKVLDATHTALINAHT